MVSEDSRGALRDNVDMISEILERLPVKSLMRFRCVSKPCRALIANPYFAKKHFHYAETGISRNVSNSRLFFSLNPPRSLDYEALINLDDHVEGQFATIELDFPVRILDYSEEKLTIFGSCNGLVCVFLEDTGIVLWNPCTRDHIVLPSPPKEYNIIAGFFGFGYDPTSDDYKIVYGITSSNMSYYKIPDKEAEIHVFSLKTASWRTVRNENHGDFACRGQLLNGALHWIDDSTKVIIFFDLAKEKFGEIVPPVSSCYDIFVYRNCLYMYQIALDDTPWLWTVWMMKEYGVKESWTRVTEFSTDTGHTARRKEYLDPLCIFENGAVLMHTFIVDGETKVDLSSQLLLVDQNTSKRLYETELSYGSAIYRETLVSPASITGIQ